jgi:hypothetical protein
VLITERIAAASKRLTEAHADLSRAQSAVTRAKHERHRVARGEYDHTELNQAQRRIVAGEAHGLPTVAEKQTQLDEALAALNAAESEHTVAKAEHDAAYAELRAPREFHPNEIHALNTAPSGQ